MNDMGQKYGFLLALSFAARALSARAAPDEDVLGKAEGYPPGSTQNFFMVGDDSISPCAP